MCMRERERERDEGGIRIEREKGTERNRVKKYD